MKKIYILICFCLIGTGSFGQTVLKKTVVSSGAVSGKNAKIQLKGTIGQPTIGTSISNSVKGKLGFWASLLSDLSTSIEQIDPAKYFDSYSLGSIYPNPGYDIVTIDIGIPETSDIKIQLYSLKGELIGELYKGKLISGEHRLSINVSQFPSGMYFYTLLKDNLILASKKMNVN
jgi:hypothetical protein